VRLTPEAHRGHHPVGCRRMNPVHALSVGEVDDDAVGMIEGEETLLRTVGQIQSELRGIPGRGEPDAPEFCTERWAKCDRADHGGGESPAKNLLYHELRSLSCLLIYGAASAFSTCWLQPPV